MTREEAVRLGNYLYDSHDVGRAGEAAVQISRTNERFQISFIIKKLNDPEIISGFRELGQDIRDQGFGPKLDINLCSENFEDVKHTIKTDE